MTAIATLGAVQAVRVWLYPRIRMYYQRSTMAQAESDLVALTADESAEVQTAAPGRVPAASIVTRLKQRTETD
jgi:hypothetical protein